MPTEPPKAVFLSYAREDTDAARRIAEALRSQGIEVWFDQRELRGGEAWDAKIKKQIRECALFLAVVSAHTQERTEGYFRREWKLAVERTQDMAAGVAFAVPVVIDDTAEAQAVVPDEFMRVQWTRLPGALPTPEFVAQVKSLLGGGRRRPTLSPMETVRTAAPMRTRPPLTPLPPLATKPAVVVVEASPEKKSGRKTWIWVVLLLVIGGAAAGFVLLREPEPPPPPPKPVAAKKPAPVVHAAPAEPVITDKSIAVLPFENMSADKENAFFADGVHEDILTNLAKIAELKVISRTSVMEYRGTTKKIQQIARELGVAFVLEGSVRRAGNKVRVVCQLIDGRTGQHVLAPDPYDRDLADIFAIQSEVAQSIAAKLQAALTSGEKATLERAPTANLTAYDLFLKAREVSATEPDLRTRITRALPLLESALQYDPKFALAWLGIANLHLSAYTSNGFDHSEARRALTKAALDKAVALDPDNALIIAMLGNYYIDVRDFTRAEEQSARLTRLFPNHASTFHIRARMAARLGTPAEALANYRKARELDPRNPAVLESLSTNLWNRRQYDEVAAVQRELLEVAPDNLSRAYLRALISFDARGSTAEVEALLAKIPPEARRSDPTAVGALSLWALIRGDADEVIRLWEQSGPNWRMAGGNEQLGIATALAVKGQPRKARPILVKERERLVALLASRPDDGNSWFQLAMTHALLGEKKEAQEVRQKMLAATSTSPIGSRQFNDVVFYAWVGEKDKALAELASRLPVTINANTLNVHRMRRSLFFKPLQGDPRFEALLNDPKNNAPLF